MKSEISITVNDLTQSIVMVSNNHKKNLANHLYKKLVCQYCGCVTPISNRRWYNRKTHRATKQIKQLSKFLFYENQKNQVNQETAKRLFFITFTTMQHRTGATDKELYYKLMLWLKNRSIEYVCVAERQRGNIKNGSDLHFHLLIESDQKFEIGVELSRWARLLSVPPHPALFDCKRVLNEKAVVSYLSKYLSKKQYAYSSLFHCRTFSISKRLRKRYKELAENYITLLNQDSDVRHFLTSERMEILHRSNFFVTLRYSPELSKTAKAIRQKTIANMNLQLYS